MKETVDFNKDTSELIILRSYPSKQNPGARNLITPSTRFEADVKLIIDIFEKFFYFYRYKNDILKKLIALFHIRNEGIFSEG